MKKHAWLRIVSAVLSAVVVAVGAMVIYAALTLNDKEFFGCRLFLILTGSMNGVIDQGELVITKATEQEALQEGDIISFISPDPAIKGKVNTHVIVRIEGSMYYTKGANNPEVDAYPVHYSGILGRVVFHSKLLGSFFRFITKPSSMLIFIVIPIIIFAVYDTRKTVKRLKEDNARDKRIKQAQDELEEKTGSRNPATALMRLKPIPSTLQVLRQNKPAAYRIPTRKQPRKIGNERTVQKPLHTPKNTNGRMKR